MIRFTHAASFNKGHAMFRFAALAATVFAVALTPAAATAGVTCSTVAAAEIAGAHVNGPRAGWDPPVWTFDMPDMNMSVDVQAYDLPAASAKAQAWLQAQVDSACVAANPAPAPTDPTAPATSTPTASAPTVDQTAAAQTLVDAATVTYVGNSWGPIPLWRVDLPSLNLSIDIAANSDADARAAVVPYVAAQMQPQAPVVAPTATVTTTAPSAPAPAAVAPITSAGVTTTPVEVERLLTPTLDPGIRSFLLAGP